MPSATAMRWGQKFKRVSQSFSVFQQISFVFSSCAYRTMFIFMANSAQTTEIFKNEFLMWKVSIV